jgi:hypothetical protein
LVVVVIGCMFGIETSCFNGPDSQIDGSSRALDDACRSGHCALSGSAVITTGPTADTLGIRIGPGPGAATIDVSSRTPVSSSYEWHVEVLATGIGSYTIYEPGCEPLEGGPNVSYRPPTDYAWVQSSTCSGTTRSPRGSVTISVADGSTLDIADVRVVGRLSSDGCD